MTTETLCYCWSIEYTDGTRFFYTDNSSSLDFLGNTYSAIEGVTPTTVAKSLGLAVDNLEMSGAFTSDITLEDVSNGKLDGASVKGYLVNHRDTSDYRLEVRGVCGEVTHNEYSFSTEVRSLSTRMNQTVGRIYTRTCPYVVGDSNCRVNLENFSQNNLTVSSMDDYRLVVNGVSLEDDLYSLGYVVYPDGTQQKIGTQTGNVLSLWDRLSPSAFIGAQVVLTQGCKRDENTCIGKFGNIVNFGGFHFIPTEDALSNIAVTGTDIYDGGSMWKDSVVSVTDDTTDDDTDDIDPIDDTGDRDPIDDTDDDGFIDRD